jgi:hypothetical protein
MITEFYLEGSIAPWKCAPAERDACHDVEFGHAQSDLVRMIDHDSHVE